MLYLPNTVRAKLSNVGFLGFVEKTSKFSIEYILSKQLTGFDDGWTGVVGLVGLLDDLLVIIMVLFYLAMLYRSTLVLHHGGQPQ